MRRQYVVSQVREHRKVDQSQCSVGTGGGRTPVDEFLADAGAHHQAPGTHSHPDRLMQRREEVDQSRLLDPVAQVQGIATSHEEGVGLLDRSGPMLRFDAG